MIVALLFIWHDLTRAVQIDFLSHESVATPTLKQRKKNFWSKRANEMSALSTLSLGKQRLVTTQTALLQL